MAPIIHKLDYLLSALPPFGEELEFFRRSSKQFCKGTFLGMGYGAGMDRWLSSLRQQAMDRFYLFDDAVL